MEHLNYKEKSQFVQTVLKNKIIRGRIETHRCLSHTEGHFPNPAMLMQWQIMEENSKTCASVKHLTNQVKTLNTL